ncbi:MAG TPA: ACP S-malonyltransferase [Thermoanaerobaculia bacterium]|nr:ACP S-malonyltransferase [Thermoanaerobaculia bacterium]
MGQVAMVFPGQGSQKVGMGRAWAEVSVAARQTFEEADEVLGEPLSRLIWEGPEEELTLTANTQPAILTVSTAIDRALAERGVDLAPVVVAGHSLGEYSALVAAGAFDFPTALALVRRRGELMQRAVPAGVGAMAAILGLDRETVGAVVAEAAAGGGVVTVANDNAPGQTVIAGEVEAVERAIALAGDRGARRAARLPVSAPFHSPLMAPARQGMAPHLAAAELRDPEVPVVVNVDARAVTRGEELRDALLRQIDAPVRWVESIELAARDFAVDRFFEIGPGNVLCGLNRRIVDGATTVSLAEPAGLDKLVG